MWVTFYKHNVFIIPVVPHKAVAEVSKMEKPIGEVSWCDAKWQSEPTDGLQGG